MSAGKENFRGRPTLFDLLPDGVSESSGAIIEDDDAFAAGDPAQDRPPDLPDHAFGLKLPIPLFQAQEGHES